MLTMKKALVLNAFLIAHAPLTSAETLRNRALGAKDLVRLNSENKRGTDDSQNADEEWSVMAENIDMSMGKTGPPTMVVTPTSAPVPDPTPSPTGGTPTTGSPTADPNPGDLPPLEIIDTTNPPDEFSMKECQGDCDKDTDCEFGLICFQRDTGTKDVPGCFGDADALGDGFDDFCIQAPDGTLVIAGDEGAPADSFPLGECQGDCDEDADCATGLTCFMRDGDEAVPGCSGTGDAGWDYCYDSSNAGVELDYQGNPDEDWDFYELTQCQGDCDYDSDCGLGLICWFREEGDDGQVPDCVGDANDLGSGSDDYCTFPQSADRLVIMGDNDGSGFISYPLDNCQGECDADADCIGDLKCFNREDVEPVPGCQGEGESGFDYCASFVVTGAPTAAPVVTTASPTLSPGNTVAPTVTPVGIPLDFKGDPVDDWNFYELTECQGDCDYDSDCGLGLVCDFRDAGGDGQVPGCIGDANTINDGSDDYCVKPQSDDRLVIMGDDDGTGFLSYPLLACQGECDEDIDCEGDLKCFLREEEEAVPGCVGVGEYGFDYCASF